MSSGTTPFDCPRCGAGLAMSERQGIEIDYCPQCRGVWLDRGELDKIIERSAAQSAGAGPATGYQDAPPHVRRYDDDHHHGDHHYGGHKKKRRGLLGEIFDFD